MATTLKRVTRKTALTHEGAKVFVCNAEQELERSVMACLLWEDSFYESGQDIYERINSIVPEVKAEKVFELALRARNEYNLRHIPLVLAKIMVKLPTHRHLVSKLLVEIIKRPDELAEFLALYWKDGRCPIANQVKKGLAKAFLKFDEYQLAKYNRDKDITLRDVMFLVHPKAQNKEQEDLFKRLINNELKTPDTWEVLLSVPGTDKRKVWTNLITENKLGSMALIRNLRNMENSGVERDIIKKALKHARSDKLLPFRFIAAAERAPVFESELEQMMFNNMLNIEKLPGKTVLLVDVSGSMSWDKVSKKSEMTRLDAACALAMLTKELCENCEVYAFDCGVHYIPNRRGFSLRDKLKSYSGGGTAIGNAIDYVNENETDMDRLIIITDEQTSDTVNNPLKGISGYILNVASYQNGIGYNNTWTTISGWSEASMRYIQELEKSK